MATLTFSVPDMTCGHCTSAVASEIRRIDGVVDVSVDLSTKEVVVTGFDLDPVTVFAAVDEAGYEPVA